MASGIYVIRNKESGKEYYGLAGNLEIRMKHPHRECRVIGRAIKKYGKENFNRRVVLYCEKWELERYEVLCIKIFHSHVSEGGYNLSRGGNRPAAGIHPTEETLIKMRKPRPQIAGKNNPRYGVPITDKTRKQMSESHKGEKSYNYGKFGKDSSAYGTRRTDEQRKAISERTKGEKHPQYGKHRTDAVKKLISDANKNPSDETRKRKSESHKREKNINFGKKVSGAASLYYGVCIAKNKGYIYWQCRTENKYLGQFKTEIDAARTYDKYIIENNIVDRPLNFPDGIHP